MQICKFANVVAKGRPIALQILRHRFALKPSFNRLSDKSRFAVHACVTHLSNIMLAKIE